MLSLTRNLSLALALLLGTGANIQGAPGGLAALEKRRIVHHNVPVDFALNSPARETCPSVRTSKNDFKTAHFVLIPITANDRRNFCGKSVNIEYWYDRQPGAQPIRARATILGTTVGGTLQVNGLLMNDLFGSAQPASVDWWVNY